MVTKFIDTVSVASIISSHVITKSLAILFKYLLISQLHILGFQTGASLHTQSFTQFLYSHQHLSLIHF